MPSHLLSQPPEELLRRWAITATAYLGGRRNQHWLVNSGKTELVLHASPIAITYELQVQQYLRREGWPVPQLIREPIRLADKTWCLLERLPGASLEDSPAERRTRGRLLAELHGSTAKLTGILDFEASHRNYRVADFALSWRGDQDEVLAGYTEVHPLSELDWQLLVPVFWSWLFLGMKQHIGDILSGEGPPHGFEWQIKHLLKRAGVLAQRAPAYPTA